MAASSSFRHKGGFGTACDTFACKQVMDTFLKDLRHSGRIVRQSAGLMDAGVTAMAVGIATNTAIFSVVNTVLLKPFAYQDAERIVMFQNTFRRAPRSGSAAPVEFNWWRQQ